MKERKYSLHFIAWLAFGVAIGTSLIRLVLLLTQHSSDITSDTINLVSSIGYVLSLLLIIFYFYKKRKK